MSTWKDRWMIQLEIYMRMLLLFIPLCDALFDPKMSYNASPCNKLSVAHFEELNFLKILWAYRMLGL